MDRDPSLDMYVMGKKEGHSPEHLMTIEWSRYLSFETFPKDCMMMPLRLAQAGFYYKRTAWDVQCFCCCISNSKWSRDETAIEVHKRLSPNCVFIQGELTDNIPINPDDQIQHPEYANVECRKRSFDNCSYQWSQDTDELAFVGFFYTGGGDTVRCFYCDVPLGQWGTDDVPWIEHVRHSPRCNYVLFQKGEEFVNTVLQYVNADSGLPDPSMPPEFAMPGVNTFTTYEKKCISLNKELKAKETEMEAQKERTESLKKENREINQNARCKICLDRNADVVFLPCRHLAACQPCSSKLQTCAICRTRISTKISVYM